MYLILVPQGKFNLGSHPGVLRRSPCPIPGPKEGPERRNDSPTPQTDCWAQEPTGTEHQRHGEPAGGRAMK